MFCSFIGSTKEMDEEFFISTKSSIRLFFIIEGFGPLTTVEIFICYLLFSSLSLPKVN